MQSRPTTDSNRGFFMLFGVLLLAGALLFAGCGSGSDSESDENAREVEAVEQGEPDQAPKAADRAAAGAVLPDLSGAAGKRLLVEVARADQNGMNPRVFAKVGDSNTEWEPNLYGLGCREVEFGSNGDLEPVVNRYRQVRFPSLEAYPDCSPANSLSRRSAAAVSGVWTEWLMTPTAELPGTGISPPTDECGPEQTPLDCEIGLISPRWVLIMSGSNDALLGRPLGGTYRRLLTQMVSRTRQLGPVPVLSTLPPMMVSSHSGPPGEERVAEANRIIRQVADSEGVPLIDLHSALSAEGMENQGLAFDGLHLGVYGGEVQTNVMGASVVLTDAALAYGANRRNLIWLQTLQKLDRVARRG